MSKIKKHFLGISKNFFALCLMPYALIFAPWAQVSASDWFDESILVSEPTELYGSFDADAFDVQHDLPPVKKTKIKIKEVGSVKTSGIQTTSTKQKDGCPFDTKTECDIWRKKPHVIETVVPKSSNIQPDKMDALIKAARKGKEINAKSDVAAPLVDRYKSLTRAGRACCREGLVYHLRKSGASDDQIYRFVMDDANFFSLSERCLFLSDQELNGQFGDMVTADMVADVRNICICRGRKWFDSLLDPFRQVYDAVPEFVNQPLEYTYFDGLKREVVVSINQDVQKVLDQMAICP